MHTKSIKICERCFLCRSIEFYLEYHKCLSCSRSICWGKTAPVLGNLRNPRDWFKGHKNVQRRLHSPFLDSTIISCYVNPLGNNYLMEALHALMQKNIAEPVTTQTSLGFGKDRVIQNGDSRDNKDVPPDRGVGHVHRFQGCLLLNTNSKPVQEVHAFSLPGSVL